MISFCFLLGLFTTATATTCNVSPTSTKGEKLYVRYRSYGANVFPQCESLEILSSEGDSWEVRFRYNYNGKLKCYNTTMKVSCKDGITNKTTFTYKLQRERQPRTRELIYENRTAGCFIYQSTTVRPQCPQTNCDRTANLLRLIFESAAPTAAVSGHVHFARRATWDDATYSAP
uniref:Putative secreted protein n=1 Tax=Amblyomma americanum TaxID=6943 RepID=A0A0C9SF99_AMBAM